MKKMKAAVLYGKNDLRVEEVPVPELTDNGVLVKVAASGICGSDLPRVLGDAAHYYPIILGHEFSGIVVETGRHVTGIKPGDRVTGAPLVPCHSCADCQRGNYSQCRHYTFIGSRIQGSWAEYVLLPERNVISVADGISFEEAAFFEPSAVALHALQHIHYQGGGDVSILGGGNIGLLALQWAKILGAKSVTVFDLDDDRLQNALKLGADRVFNTSSGDWREAALSHTNGRGFDVVLETAGSPVTMNLSFELAANKAKVCFIGTSARDLSFPHRLFELMNRKEFTLTGSWMSYSAPFPGREWELTGHFLAEGKLNFKDMIFARYPLARIQEAFDLYRTPGAVKGKIILNGA